MEDEDDPAEVIGKVLGERNETLAVAESATGGLISSRVTDVPGASEYFDRGFVTYAYRAKMGMLGVDRALLDAEGAVCEAVAARMATAARDRAETDWAVSITGIAGPTGGTAEKPVGLAYIGVAYAAPWGSGGSTVDVAEYEFEGTRCEIKSAMAEQALADLRAAIANQ